MRSKTSVALNRSAHHLIEFGNTIAVPLAWFEIFEGMNTRVLIAGSRLGCEDSSPPQYMDLATTAEPVPHGWRTQIVWSKTPLQRSSSFPNRDLSMKGAIYCNTLKVYCKHPKSGSTWVRRQLKERLWHTERAGPHRPGTETRPQPFAVLSVRRAGEAIGISPRPQPSAASTGVNVLPRAREGHRLCSSQLWTTCAGGLHLQQRRFWPTLQCRAVSVAPIWALVVRVGWGCVALLHRARHCNL